MKRTKLILIFTLAIVISLSAGCSAPKTTSTATPSLSPTNTPAELPVTLVPSTPTLEPIQTLDLDLEEVYQACMAYQTINSGTEAPFMFPSDFSDPYWDGVYPGLSSIDLKQVVLYLPPIATFACEVVLVEVSNNEDISTVYDIFEQRIKQGATGTSCDQENALLWQTNARIYQEGNYVGMIVLPAEYLIFESIFSEIK